MASKRRTAEQKSHRHTISVTVFPAELWTEVRIMAVLNKVHPSAVMAAAVTEYLLKHRNRAIKSKKAKK